MRQHYWEKLSRIATQNCSCFMLQGWLYIFSANNQEGGGWEQVGSWLICRTSFISPKENCSLGLPLVLTPSAGALILPPNHFPTIHPMTCSRCQLMKIYPDTMRTSRGATPAS